MVTAFLVVLALVTGTIVGRVSLNFLNDLGNYLPLLLPNEPRTKEEVELLWSRFLTASSMVGAMVSVVWVLTAVSFHAYGCAVLGALTGGLVMPILALIVVLIVLGLENIGAYVQQLGGLIDRRYEDFKAWLRQEKAPESNIRQYLTLTATKGINSPEADEFLNQHESDSELHDIAAALKKAALLSSSASTAE